MPLPRRRQSDTGRDLRGGDDLRGGSLRMRTDKSRARLVIPSVGGEDAGLSPLKQLQRLKEAGSLSHLPCKQACIPLDRPDTHAHTTTTTSTSSGGKQFCRQYSATLPRNMGRSRFASEPNVLELVDGDELEAESGTDLMTTSDTSAASSRLVDDDDDEGRTRRFPPTRCPSDGDLLNATTDTAATSDRRYTLQVGISPMHTLDLTPNYTPPTPLQFLTDHPLKDKVKDNDRVSTDTSPTSPPLPPPPPPVRATCPTNPPPPPPTSLTSSGCPSNPPPPPPPVLSPGSSPAAQPVSPRAEDASQGTVSERHKKLMRPRSRPKRPAPPPPPRPPHITSPDSDCTDGPLPCDTSPSSESSESSPTDPVSHTHTPSTVTSPSYPASAAVGDVIDISKRASRAGSDGTGHDSDTSSSSSRSRARLPPPPKPPPPPPPATLLSPTKQTQANSRDGVPLLPGGDCLISPQGRGPATSISEVATSQAKPKVVVKLVKNESPTHRWSTSSEGSYQDVNQNRLGAGDDHDSSSEASNKRQSNVVRVNLMKQRQAASEERDLDEDMSCLSVSSKRLSKSAEELDRERALALIDLTGPYLTPRSLLRTSFRDPADVVDTAETTGIYSSIGDVQTLLKTDVSEAERIYSLPQPQSFSDDTLKAVKKITEKYDTLERRKMRAMSFRDNSRCSGTPSNPNTPACVSDLKEGTLFKLGDNKECESVPVDKGVNARDVARIDLFYRGRGTDVRVCKCLADLSFCLPNVNNELVDWEPVKATGVPVYVLNTGTGKRKRELFIILAERETGFPLWRDKINYLSNYRLYDTSTDTHVMQLSSNLRKVASLKFYCSSAADDFLKNFTELTCDPNDELWKISGSKPGKKRWALKRSSKQKGPAKKDISTPCNFTHMTKVDQEDELVYETFSDGLAGTASESGSETGAGYRSRLSTT